MRCPSCGEENPALARFCMGCGTALVVLCAACGQQHPPGARFYMSCGGSLAAPTSPVGTQTVSATGPRQSFASPTAGLPPHDRLAAAGERKQITVLFCDLVNSVGMTEDLGSERF